MKKQPPVTDSVSETPAIGAPQSLNWISRKALEFQLDYDLRKKELNALIVQSQKPRIHDPAKDGEKEPDFPALIRQAESNLSFASANVRDWLKLEGVFDKQIAPERRTGEQISVVESQDIFRQFMLIIRISRKDAAIKASALAAECKDPKDIYPRFLSAIESADESAMASALADHVVPVWLAESK